MQIKDDFGAQIVELLAVLHVTDIDDVAVVSIAERIVPENRRSAVLAVLSQPDFDPRAMPGNIPKLAQILLAALQRAGAAGIHLPRCSSCQRERVLTRKDENGTHICHRCAERRHYAECPSCKRIKKLTQSDEHGIKVCNRCIPGAPDQSNTCEKCGRSVIVGSILNSKWICLNCYPKPTHRCVACGQQKKIASTILHGKHCHACHNRVLRNPRPCPTCGEKRILAFLDPEHMAVCAGCAGQPARYACRRCGSEEHSYGANCGLCTLDDRCRENLAGPDGTLSEPMEKLRRYLLTKPRPEQIIKWFRMGKSIPLLRSIARGETPLEEATLMTANQNNSLKYLRALLLDAGVMPREHASTRQLEAWITEEVAQLTAERRQVITTYARWSLLRRTIRDQTTGDISPGGSKHVQAAVRGIITFFNWLDERDTALSSVSQAQIEEFITVRSSQRWLPQFLAWADQREMVSDVIVPSKATSAPSITGLEQQHEDTIRHLVSDESITLDARFAGLLIAVYGLPATRTLRLRCRQVRATQEGVELLLGEHPLILATPIATIARQHLASLQMPEPDSWLFPGMTPGGHRDPQYLNRRLEPLNINIATLQNAARFKLAGAVPSKILADAIGFGVATFERYANLSASARGDYPALRTLDSTQDYR